MSDNDSDLDKKSFGDGDESDSFSNEQKVKESASSQNSQLKKEEEKQKEISKLVKNEDKREIENKKSTEKEDKDKINESSNEESSDSDDKKKKPKKDEKKEEKKEEKREEKKEDKKEEDKKEDKKDDKKEEGKKKNNKKKKGSDSDSDSSSSSKKSKKSSKKDKKENDEDKALAKELDDDESSSSSDEDKKNKKKKVKKDEEKGKEKEKEKKENEENEKDKEKKEREEKERKKKEKEEKERKEKEERERERKERERRERERRENEEKERREKEQRDRNSYQNRGYDNNNRNRDNNQFFSQNFSRSGNQNNMDRNNNIPNINDTNGSYQQKKAKKFDSNRVKELNKIVTENNEIISEMKSAYPGFTQLECASVFQKVKLATSQTIFEIMNQIHRDISILITINEAENRNKKEYLLPIDPYEIIDPVYNNPEHIKMMKYFHIYKREDKEKLPPYLQEILKDDYYFYTNEVNKRRKVIKYPDGSFNYIPIKCDEGCKNPNCIYSHNDCEMEFHPLFYKTKFSNSSKGVFSKTSDNLLKDFRIIYNYKNENIINLIKLLDEKKIANTSFKDFCKNKINSFELETFKTLECPHIKNGMECPKKDSHLCYYYHDISERRRPPTLYRYTNEMCPNQQNNKNGKIKSRCKNGDFCHLCHTRYELFYHKLLYGKAMTCLRKKKNGKCIYEETCYAYHPYKEPGYKKTREEIIQEKKDELLDQYTEEHELLNSLISHYKCQCCNKYNKKFKFVLLANCEHIICHKCFKEKALNKKKCPISNCKKKFDTENKEECIEMNIKESAEKIDELIQKNYKEKLEKEKEGKTEKTKKEKEKKVDEDKNDKKANKKEKEKEKEDNNEKSEKSEKSEDDDDGQDNNNSMG